MKKETLLLISLSLMFTSCATEQDKRSLQSECDSLQIVRNTLYSQVYELNEQKSQLKYVEEKRDPKYVLKLHVYQSHVSLSIKKHIQDKANSFDMEIPVDKDYYNSVNVGQEIVEKFRMGSFVLSGSFGDWNIEVRDKYLK